MNWMSTWRDPNESTIAGAVSIDAPWAAVERFSTLVRESGTPAERQAVEYLIERLSSWEVPHTLYEPEVLISLPRGARLEVQSPERRALAAKTPSMSLSTAGRWRTGNLMYVSMGHTGSIASLFERTGDLKEDVAGRAVLTDGYPSPGKVADLQDAGAVAGIFISPGERIHEGICTTIWGSPDLDGLPRKPRIPVLAINKTEGAWLKELAGAGGVKVRYSTNLEERWRPIPVLVAEIRGREEPEKFVLLHGHIDSWHEGVGDNATGDATLLEVARVLWQHRDRLRRSVRIAWWSGHSHGRYAGSTWYADAFGLDIDENCIVHINCDSPGCRWASVFEDVFWMPEAEGIAKQVISDVAGQEAQGGRPLRAGDKSFSNIGVSTFYMLSSTMPQDLLKEKGYYPVGGCGGNIAWHTEDDTMQIADRDNLLRDVKVYAVATFRAANTPLYPLDFTAAAQDISSTLKRYQDAARGQLDLQEALDEAEGLEGDLRRFYEETGNLAGEAVTHPKVRRANEIQRRLARVLVPINYSRAGRFRHDPAVDIPPLPDLAQAQKLAALTQGGDAFRTTLVHLIRGRNRVIGALREARRIVQEAGL